MKKEYTTPTLVCTGDVVEQTRRGSMAISEDDDLTGKHPLAGSVGYYL
jgi:hypothetical protein